jgi:hypothetical protein
MPLRNLWITLSFVFFDASVSLVLQQPHVLPLFVAGEEVLGPCKADCTWSGFFPLPKKFCTIPVDTAVINAATGRITVITGSRMAQETAMESTPDSGVAIIKDSAAPSLAPCFFKPATTGITPQLQSGMGMPKRADKKTGFIFPVPRYFFMLSALKKI